MAETKEFKADLKLCADFKASSHCKEGASKKSGPPETGRTRLLYVHMIVRKGPSKLGRKPPTGGKNSQREPQNEITHVSLEILST